MFPSELRTRGETCGGVMPIRGPDFGASHCQPQNATVQPWRIRKPSPGSIEPRRRAIPPVRKIHEQRSVRLPLRDQQRHVARELDRPVRSLGQAQVGDPIIAGEGRIHRIVGDCINPLVGPTTAEVLVCCVGLAAVDLESRDSHYTPRSACSN